MSEITGLFDGSVRRNLTQAKRTNLFKLLKDTFVKYRKKWKSCKRTLSVFNKRHAGWMRVVAYSNYLFSSYSNNSNSRDKKIR